MKFLVVLALFAAAAAEPKGYFYGKHNYYNRVLYRGKRHEEGEAAPGGIGKREAEPYNWQPGYPGGYPYVATPEVAPYVAAEHYGRKKRAAEAAAKAAPEAAANGVKKAGYGYAAPAAAPAAAPVAKYGYGYGYEPTAERADHIYGIQEMGGEHGYLGKREAEDDWAGYHYGDEEMVGYHSIGKREAYAGYGGAAPKAGYPNGYAQGYHFIGKREADAGLGYAARKAGYGYAPGAPIFGERRVRPAAEPYWGRRKRHAEAGRERSARVGAASKAGYGYGYAPGEMPGYQPTVAERGVRPVAEMAGRGKRHTEAAQVAYGGSICLRYPCVAGYP